MAEQMSYKAVYRRDEDGKHWLVKIPTVPGCHSYGRSLSEARQNIREALSLFVKDAQTATIEDDIKLPTAVSGKLSGWQGLVKRLRATQTRVDTTRDELLVALKAQHLGMRDIGELVGVSHQRIHQLKPGKAIHKRRKTG
jgi:predicted RNase H-like HicB family nuclease